MTIKQGFPPPNFGFTDRNGQVTPPWRQFLISLFNRTGGATGSDGYFAFVNGNAAERFQVADAVGSHDATPLSQVNSQIRDLAGQGIASVPLGAASPLVWSAPANGSLSVGGNGVQGITLKRATATTSIARHYGMIPVRSGDEITITYIGSPVLTWIPD